MTYNVWGSTRWPERKTALQKVLKIHHPDVLCLQEVTPEILESIKEVLTSHECVEDTREGWQYESNIFWRSDLFMKRSHSFFDVGIVDHPQRGLFSVDLEICGRSDLPLVTVNTVHMPWPGCPTEIHTGINQRIVCAQKIVNIMNNMNSPTILVGDFNESFHPQRILREAGFVDVFTSLNMPPPITHPVRSSDPRECSMPDASLDWILTRLGANCTAVAASCINVRGPNCASDHLPVSTVIELSAFPHRSR